MSGCACSHSAGCSGGPISGDELPPVDRRRFNTSDSGATTGLQDKVPGGWIVVPGGRHVGWEWSHDNREYNAVTANEPIKTLPNGTIYWRAPAGSAGELKRAAWHPKLWELVGMVSAQIVSNSKSANDPTGANAPQRVALTTGAATLISFAADTVRAVLKGKAGNAAMAYLATTAANILVATTRFEISQDFAIDVYPGTAVYVTGTTGDHVDVYEYEGT